MALGTQGNFTYFYSTIYTVWSTTVETIKISNNYHALIKSLFESFPWVILIYDLRLFGSSSHRNDLIGFLKSKPKKPKEFHNFIFKFDNGQNHDL